MLKGLLVNGGDLRPFNVCLNELVLLADCRFGINHMPVEGIVLRGIIF